MTCNTIYIAAQTSCSLLALTTLSLLVPAAFSVSTPDVDTDKSILHLSHAVSIVLLIVYILYLLFQVTPFYRCFAYLFIYILFIAQNAHLSCKT